MSKLLDRRNALAAAAGILVEASSPTLGQTVASGTHPLHGVWALLSLEDHQPDGQVVYSWGKGVSGTIVYTLTGRMFVQILGDPHPGFSAGNVFSPDGRTLLPIAKDDEIRNAYAGYYAYFGTYLIDEARHVVTHHVESSLRPHEIGLNFERPYDLTEDRLVLRYSPSKEAGANTRIVTWRRAETLRR